MMMLRPGKVYSLRNGKLGHVRAYHVGNSRKRVPTHYQGAIEGQGLTKWLPYGKNVDSRDWDVLGTSKHAMTVKGGSSDNHSGEEGTPNTSG